MRRLLLLGPLAGLAAACGSGERASSIDFPTRPIVIKAPAGPGGGWDRFARLIQQALTEEKLVPVPVQVVNRGGAGGTIALADLVSKDRGDPHVVMVTGRVMVGAVLTHRSAVHLRQTTPLARLASSHEAVAVAASSPYRTLQELVSDFRRAPETVTWAGGSAGGTDHMLVGLLARAAGVPMTAVHYVAFSGGGEALASVLGNQVTAGVATHDEWREQAEAGLLRFLAVSSERRLPGDPTPTVKESGFDVVLDNWRGLVAPPGIDEKARRAWTEIIRRMRDSDRWKEILQANGWQDSYRSGDAFEHFLEAEHEESREILTAVGLLEP